MRDEVSLTVIDELKVVASNPEYIQEIGTFSKQMGSQILEEQREVSCSHLW